MITTKVDFSDFERGKHGDEELLTKCFMQLFAITGICFVRGDYDGIDEFLYRTNEQDAEYLGA